MTDLAHIVTQLQALDSSSVRSGVSRHFIEIQQSNGEVTIGANREGLVWLALQLTALALKDEPGSHYHLDETTMADSASVPVVLRLSVSPWVT